MVTLIAVSSKHFAILALNTRHGNYSKTNYTMANIAPAHAGVNVLLGGCVLTCMVIMIVCLCLFCHWRLDKSDDHNFHGNYAPEGEAWMPVSDDVDNSAQIFTLDHECFDRSYLEREFEAPPPSYDEVMKKKDSAIQNDMEDPATTSGYDPTLPSYETAVSLHGTGYV